MGIAHLVVVANTHGYAGPVRTLLGRGTSGGVARVDVPAGRHPRHPDAGGDLEAPAPEAHRVAERRGGADRLEGGDGVGIGIVGTPVVRQLPNEGVAGLLMLEECHIAVHTFPARQLVLLDVLVLETHDAEKALDVFARRLGAREIRSELRARG